MLGLGIAYQVKTENFIGLQSCMFICCGSGVVYTAFTISYELDQCCLCCETCKEAR